MAWTYKLNNNDSVTINSISPAFLTGIYPDTEITISGTVKNTGSTYTKLWIYILGQDYFYDGSTLASVLRPLSIPVSSSIPFTVTFTIAEGAQFEGVSTDASPFGTEGFLCWGFMKNDGTAIWRTSEPEKDQKFTIFKTRNEKNASLNLETSAIGIGKKCSSVTANKIEINNSWKIQGFFPIGSLYFSTNDINPSAFYGGTWARYSGGRTIVGVGTGTDSNGTSKTYTIGGTEGVREVTLTAANLPSHSHQFRRHTVVPNGTGRQRVYGYDLGSKVNNLYTSYVGGGQPHNNLQPFRTVYIWERTA